LRNRASGITDAAAKQQIVKELYEKFFQTAFSGTSDRLGIVYTPNEIVDFIIHSVDDALKAEFGASLSDKGVHVLDPFTGTGTFIVRLLQSGLIKPEDLAYKYRYELHANELVLLAYYVAAINIEETYHELAGGEYVPFEGIVLTDTFQMNEADDELDNHGVFPENNERAEAQKALDIRVVIGNPPYSKGQESGNDNNQNLNYPTLDAKISATYAARSTAQNKNNLYDSYIRAIRWASDRVGDRGIVSFVSNGGFIDGNTADGLRKTFAAEFSSIYVFNLRGNQRTPGEQSRKEGGKVFGNGSRATVAIYLLIKNPDDPKLGKVFYRDIGDYLTREQKLEVVRTARSYTGIDWTTITPNAEGDWVNQRNAEFESFTLLASKDKSDQRNARALRTYSAGVRTNRDAWVFNFSRSKLALNVERLIAFYNTQVTEADSGGTGWLRDNDPTQISWSDALAARLARREKLEYNSDRVRTALYRPFSRVPLYYDGSLLERTTSFPGYAPLLKLRTGVSTQPRPVRATGFRQLPYRQCPT
jgi:predicted helicase